MQINKYHFFHLIPHDGYGGVEKAANSLNFYRDKDFDFKVFFINKNYLNDKGKPLQMIKNIFKNNLEFIFSLKNRKNIILISSLWKSSLLASTIKIFRKDIKLILFLHCADNYHILDKFITSVSLLLCEEVWADSLFTINKRLDCLIFKRKKINKRVISFLIKKHHSLPKPKLSPFFIYWGRINNKQKNLSGVLKFFKIFAHIDKSAKLIIIGKDDGFQKELEKKIQKYGIEKNVQIFDFMEFENIKSYAKECSFFLQLSFFEGFSMSVVEAMQLGLVPIVTSVGEISKYCIDNFNSVIYKGDKKTFNDISNLLDNEEMYLSIRKKAIEKWSNQRTYKEDIISGCKSFLEIQLNSL